MEKIERKKLESELHKSGRLPKGVKLAVRQDSGMKKSFAKTEPAGTGGCRSTHGQFVG